MPLLPRLASLWRNLVHKAQHEQELSEELDSYLEMLIDQKREAGLGPDEARRAALLELGGKEQVKEQVREIRLGYWLETLWQDVRYAVRVLRKNPGFSLIAIFTLAVGIGANSTIFTFFNGVLLRPLPYPEARRIVLLDEIAAKRGGDSLGVSYPNYLDWRAQNQAFTDIGGYHLINFTLTNVTDVEQLGGAMASHGFFQLLGVAPLLGRTFTPEEDQPGGTKIVILSHGVWQRHFGGDPNIIGRTVTLGGPRQVVGVMPPVFHYPAGAAWWIPLTLTPKGWPRTMHGMGAIARLKPGVTLAQAQSEMNNISERMATQYPDSNAGIDVRVTGLHDALAQDYRRALWTLLGVVGFVLLIACANVANLLLARANARQREMAVRAALGAGRWRIVRQVLAESLLLSAVGGGAGMLLAFTFVVSLLTSLLFGAAPAWQSSRVDLHKSLKTGGRHLTGGNQLYHVLVVAQFALALILLIGAGLMMRSFLRLQQVNLGFNPDNVMTLRVTTPGAGYKDGSGPFFDRLLERVNAVPGVTSAGAIAALPLTGVDDNWGIGLVAENQPGLSLQYAPRISTGIVTPQYFRTMEIPLLAGRAFDATETQDVAMIDEWLARTDWPDANPLGQRIRIGQADDRPPGTRLSALPGPCSTINSMPRRARRFTFPA